MKTDKIFNDEKTNLSESIVLQHAIFCDLDMEKWYAIILMT